MCDPWKLSYDLLCAILWFNCLHDLVFPKLDFLTLFPLAHFKEKLIFTALGKLCVLTDSFDDSCAKVKNNNRTFDLLGRFLDFVFL